MGLIVTVLPVKALRYIWRTPVLYEPFNCRPSESRDMLQLWFLHITRVLLYVFLFFSFTTKLTRVCLKQVASVYSTPHQTIQQLHYDLPGIMREVAIPAIKEKICILSTRTQLAEQTAHWGTGFFFFFFLSPSSSSTAETTAVLGGENLCGISDLVDTKPRKRTLQKVPISPRTVLSLSHAYTLLQQR